MPSDSLAGYPRGNSPGGFESGVLFFGVFGAVYSSLVSFAYFVACFFAVAGVAEGLEVVEAVCASACDVEDVVYF